MEDSTKSTSNCKYSRNRILKYFFTWEWHTLRTNGCLPLLTHYAEQIKHQTKKHPSLLHTDVILTLAGKDCY